MCPSGESSVGRREGRCEEPPCNYGCPSPCRQRSGHDNQPNLAAEFPQGPTKPAFDKIWKAVGEKQAYETKQIKSLFHGKEAKTDMEAVVKASEVEHANRVLSASQSRCPVANNRSVTSPYNRLAMALQNFHLDVSQL